MPLIPPSPSLEQLKNQAKDLLRAYRAADPRARLRVQAHHPRPAAGTSAGGRGRAFLLSDALLVVAREHGYPSWSKLKASVESMVRGVGTGAAPAGPALSAKARTSSRQRFIRELAAELVGLARRREVEQLARRFGRMPLGDILSVRADMVENGEYSPLVDALIEGLGHANPRVRFDCAHVMDHLADERCAEPLRRLLDDPVPRVRRVALHSLGCDACKLAPLPTDDDLVALTIERALADPSITVRRHATSGLGGRCSDPCAVTALETLLARETDPAIRRDARRALRRHQSGGQRALRAEMGSR